MATSSVEGGPVGSKPTTAGRPKPRPLSPARPALRYAARVRIEPRPSIADAKGLGDALCLELDDSEEVRQDYLDTFRRAAVGGADFAGATHGSGSPAR